MEKLTVEAKVEVIHLTVLDMHHRLFGNGQPGEIAELHSRVSDTNKRVDTLENWRSYVLGGLAVTGFVIGLALAVAKLFR